ncbi:MAG: PASTA domain-containing protein [Bradyrhizobiaceae bacterium]|nr:PASTA domain-containing protein [Bradyrhizobiaceae bacterium]
MAERESYDAIRWKAGVMILFFGIAFTVVIGRLFWIQVMQGSRFREMARRQYESKVELRAERGSLFDRHGREIVGMLRTTSFAVDPTMIENPQLIAQVLSVATGESADRYLAQMADKSRRFAWLARGINTALNEDLEHLNDPGLIRVTEPKRNFIYGPVGAQLVGTTDVDNNGLTGLELQYDSLLRGKSGFMIMQRDGRGRLRPGVNPERQRPRDGYDLDLTIDIDFQRVVEQELRRGVQDAGAVGGTVVAIEPSTGDILAMASVPSFDPSRLDKASSNAIRIRAITDQYEPGSTIKAVTASALIEERKLAPNDRVDGNGGQLTIGSTVIRDDHALGPTSFKIALEQSSNVVFASSSRLLNDKVFYKYVRDFGFGIPTGVDLPGEVRGILKRPSEFGDYTKLYMAFGYEMSCTALQMLNAYAAIANGGVMMEPRCVRAIKDANGKTVKEFPPQRIRQVVSERTAHDVTSMLVGVVEKGTGKNAQIPGVQIAGKTGTAQQLVDGSYSQKAYTASFVGFYPAHAPRIAMIVMLDRPTTSIYGGTASAPIFRRIVQKTMTMLRLDLNTIERITASATADSVIVPDIRGLSPLTADTVLRRLGLSVDDPADSGVVLKQHPPYGQHVERGTKVTVTLTPRMPQSQPDVRGMLLRRAITVLHAAGYEVRVRGHGKVVSQQWSGKTCTVVAQ